MSVIVKFAWSAEDANAPTIPVSQPGGAYILPAQVNDRVTEGSVRVYRNTSVAIASGVWYLNVAEDLELNAGVHTILLTGATVTTRGAYLSLVVAGDTSRELLPTEGATLAWEASGTDSLRLSFTIPTTGRYDLRICFRDAANSTPNQKALTLYRVLLVQMPAQTSVTTSSSLVTGCSTEVSLFPDIEFLCTPEHTLRCLADATVLTHEAEAQYTTDYAVGQAMVLEAVSRDLHFVIAGSKPALDLRSVYGTPETREPFLDIRKRFRLDSVRHDLPRDGYGTPLVVDISADSSYLQAQIHLLLLRFHNRVMDHFANANAQQGIVVCDKDLFDRAHACVVRHWQFAVLYDTIRGLVERNTFVDICRCGQKYFPVYSNNDAPSSIPVEFTYALAKVESFLHRDTYPLAKKETYITDQQCRYYVKGLVPPAPLDIFAIFNAPLWPSGAVDSYVPIASALSARSQGCFHGATRDVASISGMRRSPVTDTLLSGNEKVASGYAVAKRMGIPPISEEELQRSDRTGVLRTTGISSRNIPLLLYIMKESEIRQEGQRLGHVGSRLLTELIRGFIWAAETNCLDPSWRPSLPRARSETYTLADIVAWTLRPTHNRF